MQERSAVLKQFPAVGRRTACGHRCGPCGRGAVRGGCVRVAWGEGSGGRGVGARGPCQGGGMRGRPAPRTSGYRLSPVRRWGWVGGAVGVGSWGRGRPRAPPLWIPAFAGMTVGVRWRGGVGGCVGGDAPRAAPLDSCLRRNDERGSRNDDWGCRGRRGLLGGGGPSTGSGRTGLWMAAATGGGGGGWGWGAAPRRAPALGSRLRGNDGGGGSGRTDWGARVRWGGGMRWGETPRAPPLWIR